MNARVKPPERTEAIQQREVVLASIRVVCQSLAAIREAVAFNGVALANGAIDPQTAIRLTEELAPGCLPPELNAICIANGWEIL
jgi:hypothetical protein